MILFGTDGVRGIANKELTPEMALKLGRAGAAVLRQSGVSNHIIIGRDTRISGQMLEGALIAGICSAGMDVINVGVMSTPGVAHLAKAMDAAGGVVISASHNPMEDNGIKFFGPIGYKLTDEQEKEIETLANSNNYHSPIPIGAKIGRVSLMEDAQERYVEFLKKAINTNLDGLKVVVDCANGAAYKIGPRVLRQLGAQVVSISINPDGTNINAGCGSTHIETLQKSVIEQDAAVGLAFDGDADRVIAVDAKGNVVDGDRIMVACARYLQSKGKLSQNTVVVTVMSNMGLRLAMQQSGIKVVETKVGDRYVLEEMLRCGACFGGEQSGHIIFLEHGTTGDGVLTALYLLKVMKETGCTMEELASQMARFPQILENVPVKDKYNVMKSPDLASAIEEMEEKMRGEGRILIRPSGTESLVRVMVEGRDMELIRDIVNDMVRVVQKVDKS